MSQPPLHVRFVALNAYPAIDPDVTGPIGGMETRAWMVARALARSGWFVDFVVRHTSPLRQRMYDGVRLHGVADRLYRIRESVSTRVERRPGFPFLKFHSFAPSLLWQLPLLAACRPFRGIIDPWQPQRVFSDRPPDVYGTFGVQSNSAAVIASARQVGRPVVLFLGSDSDLDDRYVEGSSFISPYKDAGETCWRIIREADVVICQTAWQQRRLSTHFGREGQIIPNPIDVAEWESNLSRTDIGELPREIGNLDRYLLWVGRAERTHKRPQLLLKLAQELPRIPCVMILNPRETDLEHDIRRSAPANLRIVRHVPFPLMPRLFAKAAALVNTSSLEGFANTFLQAALSRVPVVSLVAGGEFLASSGAGTACGGDWEQFRQRVNSAWNHSPSQSTLDRARSEVISGHALPIIIEQLEEVLAGATSKRGDPA